MNELGNRVFHGVGLAGFNAVFAKTADSFFVIRYILHLFLLCFSYLLGWSIRTYSVYTLSQQLFSPAF